MPPKTPEACEWVFCQNESIGPRQCQKPNNLCEAQLLVHSTTLPWTKSFERKSRMSHLKGNPSGPWPRPRLILVQPVSEPQSNVIPGEKRQTVNPVINKLPRSAFPDFGDETLLFRVEDEDDKEEEDTAAEPPPLANLKKMTWIWPELRRRNAICEEIEKLKMADDKEARSLLESREELKAKVAKKRILK